EQPAAAARALLDEGPALALVTLGGDGALIVTSSAVEPVPAPRVAVVDTIGAGDAFAGGFMGYLAHAGRFDAGSIRAAMIYGSVMGSFSVEQFSLDGLRNLTPALIQARFDAFHDLTRFDRITL
ncbi:MAG TPA: PfkB family carbohydrate kinase, partial [Kofleriaceae bacterium]|nr:PfkB family carbohydrate kinase [Kofleriaceae bacterium]